MSEIYISNPIFASTAQALVVVTLGIPKRACSTIPLVLLFCVCVCVCVTCTELHAPTTSFGSNRNPQRI